MGEVDAQRLRHQPKEIAVAVEAPRPPLLDDPQPRFVVAVEDLAAQLAPGRPVDELHRVRTDPARAHHRDQGIGHDAAHGGRCLQIFQFHGRCRQAPAVVPSPPNSSACSAGACVLASRLISGQLCTTPLYASASAARFLRSHTV